MPRTFTFTPADKDQVFAITVVRDEQTVINVSDGNAKLQLSISTTRGGSPIIQIPSTGGKFDLRPSVLESLDEGMTYQHNIWDYSSSTDGKRIATGTFTHAESIKSVDIAYPTVTLPDGSLRIFVTQTQYDSINPKDPNAEYIVDGSVPSTAAVITLVAPPTVATLITGNTLAAKTTQGSATVDKGGITTETTWKDEAGNAIAGDFALTEGLVVIAVDTHTASTGGAVLVSESDPVTVRAAVVAPVIVFADGRSLAGALYSITPAKHSPAATSFTRLEKSLDGLTGWRSVTNDGLRVPYDLEGSYLRAADDPDGDSNNAAYSEVVGPLGMPDFLGDGSNQFLNLSTRDSGFYYPHGLISTDPEIFLSSNVFVGGAATAKPIMTLAAADSSARSVRLMSDGRVSVRRQGGSYVNYYLASNRITTAGLHTITMRVTQASGVISVTVWIDEIAPQTFDFTAAGTVGDFTTLPRAGFGMLASYDGVSGNLSQFFDYSQVGLANFAIGKAGAATFHAERIAGAQVADTTPVKVAQFPAVRTVADPTVVEAFADTQPANWVKAGASLSWIKQDITVPPFRTGPVFYPRYSTSDYAGTRRLETGFIGLTDPAELNVTAMTLAGTNILPNYNASTGVFTVTGFGALAATVAYKGITYNITGEIHEAQTLLPASQQQWPNAAGGNGIAANIPLYVSPGAGTAFANLAALKTAIDNLAAGATLIVADANFTGQGTLFIPARDYAGASIRCENVSGVVLDRIENENVDAGSYDNLTISGFKPASFELKRTDGCLVEYIERNGSLAFTGRGAGTTGTLRCTYAHGDAVGQLTLGDFDTLTFENHISEGLTTANDFTTYRDYARKLFAQHNVTFLNNAPESAAHTDAFQLEGSNQIISGYYRKYVHLDYEKVGIETTQGILVNPTTTIDMLFEEGITDNTLSISLSVQDLRGNNGIERVIAATRLTAAGDNNSVRIADAAYSDITTELFSDGGNNVAISSGDVLPSRNPGPAMKYSDYVSGVSYPNAGPQAWLNALISAAGA